MYITVGHGRREGIRCFGTSGFRTVRPVALTALRKHHGGVKVCGVKPVFGTGKATTSKLEKERDKASKREGESSTKHAFF